MPVVRRLAASGQNLTFMNNRLSWISLCQEAEESTPGPRAWGTQDEEKAGTIQDQRVQRRVNKGAVRNGVRSGDASTILHKQLSAQNMVCGPFKGITKDSSEYEYMDSRPFIYMM